MRAIALQLIDFRVSVPERCVEFPFKETEYVKNNPDHRCQQRLWP